jgi:hypothetical protein
MYTTADTVDELIQKSFDPQLMDTIVQVVAAATKEKPRLFDNGRTFSGVAFGINPLPSPGYETAGAINITARKDFIAIYVYGGYPDFSAFPKSTVGRGCLRIKNQAFLDQYLQEIEQVVTTAI